MVTTKITLQLEPHDLKIINEALLLLVARMEDANERPEAYMPTEFGELHDGQQLEMFKNDAKLKANETRAILNAIN
jgi:hypothetical protein